MTSSASLGLLRRRTAAKRLYTHNAGPQGSMRNSRFPSSCSRVCSSPANGASTCFRSSRVWLAFFPGVYRIRSTKGYLGMRSRVCSLYRRGPKVDMNRSRRVGWSVAFQRMRLAVVTSNVGTHSAGAAQRPLGRPMKKARRKKWKQSWSQICLQPSAPSMIPAKESNFPESFHVLKKLSMISADGSESCRVLCHAAESRLKQSSFLRSFSRASPLSFALSFSYFASFWIDRRTR
jgi:hypothetical protein